MRVEQLKCLADVAVTGSISHTAQRLFLSQQAVSKNIKQLEEEFGVEILKRTHMGVTLTKSGAAVVAFAQKVIAEEEGLLGKLEAIKDDQNQDNTYAMDIGSTSPVTNLVLPNVLSQLYALKKNPSVGILPVPDVKFLLDKVGEQQLDLGLITINELELENYTDYDELELDLLLRDDLTVVTNKRVLLTNDVTLDGDGFVSNPIRCLFNIHPIESMRESIYAANVICSNDVDFHRNMLEQTDAMVLMPTLAYRSYFNTKKYVAAPFENINAKKYNLEIESPAIVHMAVYRKDAPQSVRDMVEMIRQELYIR